MRQRGQVSERIILGGGDRVLSLILTTDQLQVITAHCEAAYPEEGCGALLGRIDSDRHMVVDVVAMTNVGETRADWFELDPRETIAVERQARAQKLSVVGYFHSHPDSPCVPSRRDTERGWPVYSYVIVTVAGGVATEYLSWTLASDGTAFEAETVIVND